MGGEDLLEGSKEARTTGDCSGCKVSDGQGAGVCPAEGCGSVGPRRKSIDDSEEEGLGGLTMMRDKVSGSSTLPIAAPSSMITSASSTANTS